MTLFIVAYSFTGQTDCVMAADSFITLGSEDLEWSDTDCAQDSDITDDELWSDDNTVVNDGPLLWDNNDTHHTNMAPTTTPLRTTLACGPTNDDPLLQGEVLIPSNSDITTNEILKDTGSTNEITANDVSPNASSESNITSNIVIPIEAPSILTCDAESLTQDGTEAMESNSQTTVLLSRCSLPEDANTYFNELADLSSSPETVAENNAMSSSMILASSNMTSPNNMLNPTGSSIIEDQYLMEQLSTISSNEIDDDFVAEDLDWN